jgi:hypothetical protein
VTQIIGASVVLLALLGLPVMLEPGLPQLRGDAASLSRNGLLHDRTAL